MRSGFSGLEISATTSLLRGRQLKARDFFRTRVNRGRILLCVSFRVNIYVNSMSV